MRVLLYSRVFSPSVGGMERCAEVLADWLAVRGHQVTVVTQTPAPHTADRHRAYNVVRRPSAPQVAAATRGADVVHINGLSVRGIAASSALGRRPVVTHAGHQAICPTGLAWSTTGKCQVRAHGGPCPYCPSRGLASRCLLLTHRGAARVAARNVCVSRYLERRLSLPRSIVIHNPVGRWAFAPRSDSEQAGLIAFAGRLVAEKGLDLLLRALALVSEGRLEVAGDGPRRAAWEQLAGTLGLKSRVRFLGALSPEQTAQLYSRAALVCVPSLWGEPFGYVAAEAMAMGRTVAATPSGALLEFLADGRGFVAVDYTPDALALALMSAFSDAAAREGAGRLARDFAVANFDADVAGERYLEVYREVAGC